MFFTWITQISSSSNHLGSCTVQLCESRLKFVSTITDSAWNQCWGAIKTYKMNTQFCSQLLQHKIVPVDSFYSDTHFWIGCSTLFSLSLVLCANSLSNPQKSPQSNAPWQVCKIFGPQCIFCLGCVLNETSCCYLCVCNTRADPEYHFGRGSSVILRCCSFYLMLVHYV